MPIRFSPVVATLARGNRDGLSARSLDLRELGDLVSPIVVFDDFRATGRPFGPHPHAGFSAVTYVFEDSPGALRSRDSLGHDRVIGPGGLCWTQAGRGLIHEELPADPDLELHGLQVFVNLSSKYKLAEPRVLWLDRSEVPEWRSGVGDCVRIVVGSFEAASSPLIPPEPFDLRDVDLKSEVSLNLQRAHNALVYVQTGSIVARAERRGQKIAEGHALALSGGPGCVTLAALRPAHLVILSGPQFREPVYADGPFIMNRRSEVEDAVARYRAGEMGHLAPLPEN